MPIQQQLAMARPVECIQAKVDGEQQQAQIVYEVPQYHDHRLTGRRVAPEGVYQQEAYCGPITFLVDLVFSCVCWCLGDARTEYTEPGTGRKVYL
mmetsp:Transcript_2779/g.5938  ORF Transcript_2779/g.5938 Transcript_2779/m.5938 type:complete len:95 (+) Transcript_2779:389-673(+)